MGSVSVRVWVEVGVGSGPRVRVRTPLTAAITQPVCHWFRDACGTGIFPCGSEAAGIDGRPAPGRGEKRRTAISRGPVNRRGGRSRSAPDRRRQHPRPRASPGPERVRWPSGAARDAGPRAPAPRSRPGRGRSLQGRPASNRVTAPRPSWEQKQEDRERHLIPTLTMSARRAIMRARDARMAYGWAGREAGLGEGGAPLRAPPTGADAALPGGQAAEPGIRGAACPVSAARRWPILGRWPWWTPEAPGCTARVPVPRRAACIPGTEP
jgi:hypothetical protein